MKTAAYWQCLLLVVACGMCPHLADAHAYMTEPSARNWLYAHTMNFYDEMSLNHNVLNFTAGICGGQRNGDPRFSVPGPSAVAGDQSGIFAQGVIVRNYTQEQTIQISITQKTAHYGRFDVRLCPLSDATLQTEFNELSEACLDANQLILAPNSTQPGLSNPAGSPERFRYFTIPENKYTSAVTTWYVLPTGVTCARCVLQWRWVTGNSCYSPGTNQSFVQTYSQNLPACNPTTYLDPNANPPEKFWNCADVSISPRTASPGDGSTSSPSISPSASDSSSPTPVPKPPPALSPPPPPVVVTLSPPPPVIVMKSPPPPVVVLKSPPPPIVVKKSPPPPFVAMKAPPPPVVVKKSPPPPVLAIKAPPPPVVVKKSPPAPVVIKAPAPPPKASKQPPLAVVRQSQSPAITARKQFPPPPKISQPPRKRKSKSKQHQS